MNRAALVAECEGLRAEIIRARDAERLRLARDLHDSTGQAIVGITMRLAAIENGCADDGLRDQLQDVRQSIETVGRDLHYLAVSFRERPDEAVSLSEGLARLAQGWTERTGIPIHSDFDVACLDGLPRQIGTVVYRIVQEALTNVAKHARTATAVTLRITLSRGTVRVSIQDDGPGFVVGRDGLAAGEHRDRLGLLGMRERLAEVAGHLRVVSEPGRGTIVAGIIPCWNPGRRDGQA